MMIRVLQSLATALVFNQLMGGSAAAGSFHTDIPETVDPNARYMIYLQGGWPETHSLSEPHRKNGLFEYDKIILALAGSGFEVISELRGAKTNPRRYVRTRTLPQIKSLIEKGVPANSITVVGFSKGGFMSLMIASTAKEPGLNLVNLAGCGTGQFRKIYESFLESDASKMQSRMLSLFDEKDTIGGSCAESKAKAGKLVFAEEILTTGDGHATFCAPGDTWIEKVAAWANAAEAAK
jgi:hypothetical protein